MVGPFHASAARVNWNHQLEYRSATWRRLKVESPADHGRTFTHEFKPKVTIKSLPAIRSRVEATPVIFNTKRNQTVTVD
jgi:hypothetical protein